MDSVEYEPLGKTPSMYNPAFVKSVREKRRIEALQRRIKTLERKVEKQGEAVDAAAIRQSLYGAHIDRKPRELSRQERVKLASFGPTFRRIVMRICRAFGVYPVELFSERRNHELTLPRFAVAYWTCRLTKLSLPQIGKLMGRDHTTVLYGKNAYVAKRAKMGRTLRPVR